jgi:hypothetical protein
LDELAVDLNEKRPQQGGRTLGPPFQCATPRRGAYINVGSKCPFLRALRLEGVRREAEDDVGASSEMFKTEQTHSERVIDAQTLVSILILDVRVSSVRMFSIARLVAGLFVCKKKRPQRGWVLGRHSNAQAGQPASTRLAALGGPA